MTAHELKILPPYFEEVRKGRKTFEIRENDRDYQTGDTVILQEYDPAVEGLNREGRYTGRVAWFKIGYVTAYRQIPGYVVFSLLKLDSRHIKGVLTRRPDAGKFAEKKWVEGWTAKEISRCLADNFNLYIGPDGIKAHFRNKGMGRGYGWHPAKHRAPDDCAD